MYEDTKVSQLVINQLTEEKFKELLDNGELDPNQLYCTDDKAGYTPPLLSTLWSDHLLNDISWLRADTFSWQSGDVYVSAYNHLVSCMADATEETETIDGIEITYYLAQNKRKICLPDQENKILELYNKTGVAWYYILDEDNTQFKLPRSKHNKYADTVPVAGNGMTLGLTSGTNNGGLASGMSNDLMPYTNLYGQNVGTSISGSFAFTQKGTGITTDPEKSGIVAQQEQDTDQYKYLYFYVGNFERDAVEQTAGINTETFNNKADRNLMNTTDNVDIVIESQLPTAENGYTWYRKYKSGWVEMGGIDGSGTGTKTITFPVIMQDANYIVTTATQSNTSTHGATVQNPTTTTVQLVKTNTVCYWQVSGMSAQ